tara:strand:+ start:4105 stop:5478 length:1374 start_codon:yes stop_codon:yes gene_type:complete
MALPFLRGETEENATQTLAFVSIVIVTLGLAVFNVCGAIAGSQSDNLLEIVIRGAFGLVITGAEFLAAVALVRVMLAKNRLRKVVGTIIFIGLAWVCIQNGKRAAHLIFPEFEQSAALLEAKAGIAQDEAEQQAAQRKAAIDATPAELERVRGRIAELRLEQQLMASQSPEKIAEAQALLISQGKYFWEVDGLRGPETERAMRARGEEIRQELDRLSLREESLSAGVASATALVSADGEVSTENLSAAAQQAVLADQARQARQAAIWIEIMLWVVEGARSFGLWALVTTITAKQSEEDEDARRRSDAAKKGWETRREKEDANSDELQIEDKGYWESRIVKAVNTGYKTRKIAGMCQTYFGTIEPGQLREHLKRQIDAHLELPKADPKKHKRAIERGLLSDERKTYLMQDHIDFIFSEGAFAPEQKEEAPKANGHDHTPMSGADDADDSESRNISPAA